MTQLERCEDTVKELSKNSELSHEIVTNSLLANIAQSLAIIADALMKGEEDGRQ